MIELSLSGLSCDGCIANVTRALCAVPGVQQGSVTVTLERATAVVSTDTTRAALIEAVEGVGFDATVAASA